MKRLKILSWNVYSHEVHEMKFQPPPPQQYTDWYGPTEDLITGRTPSTCLYHTEKSRADDDAHLFQPEDDRSYEEPMCHAKSILQEENGQHWWTRFPHDASECRATDENVQLMEWPGKGQCVLSLTVPRVHKWQVARNAFYERCLSMLALEVPLMCFQEVDSDNVRMLQAVAASNERLRLYSDMGPHADLRNCDLRCGAGDERGLAIIFDSKVIELTYYSEFKFGRLPCTQCLQFKFEGVAFCLCNVHMFVADHKESYLTKLLEFLQKYKDDVFVFVGDMNMRTVKSKKWVAMSSAYEPPKKRLDHVLTYSDSYDIRLRIASDIERGIKKVLAEDDGIGLAVDAVERSATARQSLHFS